MALLPRLLLRSPTTSPTTFTYTASTQEAALPVVPVVLVPGCQSSVAAWSLHRHLEDDLARDTGSWLQRAVLGEGGGADEGGIRDVGPGAPPPPGRAAQS